VRKTPNVPVTRRPRRIASALPSVSSITRKPARTRSASAIAARSPRPNSSVTGAISSSVTGVSVNQGGGCDIQFLTSCGERNGEQLADNRGGNKDLAVEVVKQRRLVDQDQ
jgi:hypothetical protein